MGLVTRRLLWVDFAPLRVTGWPRLDHAAKWWHCRAEYKPRNSILRTTAGICRKKITYASPEDALGAALAAKIALRPYRCELCRLYHLTSRTKGLHMPVRRVKIFFDGGCRPNPGPMEAAVVLRGAVHFHDDLGVGSNSDAEWLALIAAAQLARSQALHDVELIGDAVEVVRQANAALRSHRPANDHEAAFLALVADTPPARIRWIKREQNLAGIALAARHQGL